jgi:hypothetical protein
LTGSNRIDIHCPVVYFVVMHYPTLTRETWVATVRQSGIRLEVLAVATGKSYSAVYRYMNGSRTPSDEWIAKCGAALAVYQSREVA